MKSSPAFRLYGNDWLSSRSITLMTPAEEGAYIRLLCYAWADPDVSIPDDDETLAKLSRLGEEWLKGSSTTLRACFVPHPKKPGRLVNVRLLQEHKQQQEWRAKCQHGGIQSGKTRALELKGSSRVVQVKANRTVEVKGNSSSSSSSSKKKKDILSETSSQTNGRLPGFEIFWKSYPRKEGKGACERWWRSHKPDDFLLGVMLGKMDHAKQLPKWQEDGGKYIPMPYTWLNQKRWEDEYVATARPRKERLPL